MIGCPVTPPLTSVEKIGLSEKLAAPILVQNQTNPTNGALSMT
jgi:hypothetical protein